MPVLTNGNPKVETQNKKELIMCTEKENAKFT